MELLGSTKNNKTKDKNVPHLENNKLKFVYWNLVNNSYQKNSRVFYTFVPNKTIGQLLGISPKGFIFLKIFNSEFSFIEVWFTDCNSKPLEFEDKIVVNSAIN